MRPPTEGEATCLSDNTLAGLHLDLTELFLRCLIVNVMAILRISDDTSEPIGETTLGEAGIFELEDLWHPLEVPGRRALTK